MTRGICSPNRIEGLGRLRRGLILAVFVLICLGTQGLVAAPTSFQMNLIKSVDDPSLHMAWDVEVHQNGGRFVVYRGRDLNSLRAIATSDDAESGRFEYTDRDQRAAFSFYRLCFRDLTGNETVLATVKVNPGGIQVPNSPRSDWLSAQSLIIPESIHFQESGGRPLSIVPSIITPGCCQEPPTPPPRFC